MCGRLRQKALAGSGGPPHRLCFCYPWQASTDSKRLVGELFGIYIKFSREPMGRHNANRCVFPQNLICRVANPCGATMRTVVFFSRELICRIPANSPREDAARAGVARSVHRHSLALVSDCCYWRQVLKRRPQKNQHYICVCVVSARPSRQEIHHGRGLGAKRECAARHAWPRQGFASYRFIGAGKGTLAAMAWFCDIGTRQRAFLCGISEPQPRQWRHGAYCKCSRATSIVARRSTRACQPALFQ